SNWLRALSMTRSPGGDATTQARPTAGELSARQVGVIAVSAGLQPLPSDGSPPAGEDLVEGGEVGGDEGREGGRDRPGRRRRRGGHALAGQRVEEGGLGHGGGGGDERGEDLRLAVVVGVTQLHLDAAALREGEEGTEQRAVAAVEDRDVRVASGR